MREKAGEDDKLALRWRDGEGAHKRWRGWRSPFRTTASPREYALDRVAARVFEDERTAAVRDARVVRRNERLVPVDVPLRAAAGREHAEPGHNALRR